MEKVANFFDANGENIYSHAKDLSIGFQNLMEEYNVTEESRKLTQYVLCRAASTFGETEKLYTGNPICKLITDILTSAEHVIFNPKDVSKG